MKTFILLGAAAASFGFIALSSSEASAAPGRGQVMRGGGGSFARGPAMNFRGPSMGHRPHVQHNNHFTPRPMIGHSQFGNHFRPHVQHHNHHNHHNHYNNWWQHRQYSYNYYRPVYPAARPYVPAPVAVQAPSCWQQYTGSDNQMHWRYVCPSAPQPQPSYTPASYTPPQPSGYGHQPTRWPHYGSGHGHYGNHHNQPHHGGGSHHNSGHHGRS